MRLPSLEDVLELPRWARVAFAVRCARRVQRLLHAHLPALTPRQLETVDRAIGFAQAVAQEAPEWAPDKVVIRLHSSFNAAAKLAKAIRKQNPVASAVAWAAAKTAESAEFACCDARTRDAARAADAARLACEAGAPKTLQNIVANLRELIANSREQGWNDQSPIPPRLFMP
jgi:hypothetical protein